MEKLKIKSFLIEYRHRLQTANCFINFSQPLDKFQTKVSVVSDHIQIEIGTFTHRIDIKKFFEIQIKSFHSLMVRDTFISFRFLTAGDQFKSELLLTNGDANKFRRIELNVDSPSQTSISCSNCGYQLTLEEKISLKRILELPSGNMDVNEWFCHRHGDEKLFNDSNCFDEETQQIKPRCDDVFYGPFNLLMRSQLFDNSRLRLKRSHLHCKRCLQLIGEKLSTSTNKFWWEGVKFGEKHFFKVANPIDLIKRVIRNHLACETLALVKIIFEATSPADDRKVQILLQIMDKCLKLLTLDLGSSELQEKQFVKLMYHRLNHSNDDDERTLKYWQKDINVTTFQLSSNMFHMLEKYLRGQSEMIPEVYRTNNCFQLSYIELL